MIQVVAWWPTGKNHYLKQWWPTHISDTRGRWVKGRCILHDKRTVSFDRFIDKSETSYRVINGMFAINFDLLTCHDNFVMTTTRMWCCSQQHIPVFIQSSIQNANASKDCGLAKIWKQHAMTMGRMEETNSEICGLWIVSTCYIG